jgi:Tfp pilus assembly protein PilF
VKYPEAMYWHASEFYLKVGDTGRALELLQKNLELRPNSTSLVALARAEMASSKATEARASIDRALAMPVRSAALFWVASVVYRGDPAKAEEFHARAVRMNPRIDEDEVLPALRTAKSPP